jgi:hypothetical protein
MVLLSRENAKNEKVTGSVEFIEGDLFNADLSKATVITLFLLPEINLKLRPKLLDLKPGTRVVSNTFTMSEWVPDSSVTTPENWNSWNSAFLWIIPAKVAGIWETGLSELNLTQEFQLITGLYSEGGKSYPVNEGKIRGNHITFIVNNDRYSATIESDTIKGTIVNAKEGIMKDFVARRVAGRP